MFDRSVRTNNNNTILNLPFHFIILTQLLIIYTVWVIAQLPNGRPGTTSTENTW